MMKITVSEPFHYFLENENEIETEIESQDQVQDQVEKFHQRGAMEMAPLSDGPDGVLKYGNQTSVVQLSRSC